MRNFSFGHFQFRHINYLNSKITFKDFTYSSELYMGEENPETPFHPTPKICPAMFSPTLPHPIALLTHLKSPRTHFSTSAPFFFIPSHHSSLLKNYLVYLYSLSYILRLDNHSFFIWVPISSSIYLKPYSFLFFVRWSPRTFFQLILTELFLVLKRKDN